MPSRACSGTHAEDQTLRYGGPYRPGNDPSEPLSESSANPPGSERVLRRREAAKEIVMQLLMRRKSFHEAIGTAVRAKLAQSRAVAMTRRQRWGFGSR